MCTRRVEEEAAEEQMEAEGKEEGSEQHGSPAAADFFANSFAEMPLQVGKEAIFCLDFAREKADYVPYEASIPSLVYRKCASDRLAFHFDSENVALTFGGVKCEMERFAAGLQNLGLKPEQRILVSGNNHSQLVVAVLGAARAGLVFSICGPNFTDAEQLRHFLATGQFDAFLYFGPSDRANQWLLELCPEMQRGQRGKLKLKTLPKLTHVIFADEDHKHAGTFTLSDVFLKGSKEEVAKLPDLADWDCHRLGAIQFTMGSTGTPKAVGLTHYQLINGCRIAGSAIGVKRDTVLCCALPLFRIPLFCLVVFQPFLAESQAVFPEPSPLPRLLFHSINKHNCTTLLSNAAALRLLLRTQPLTQSQKVSLPSVQTVVLLGERVSADLLISIERMMPKAKGIAVGMLSTELGCIPILSDNTTNLVKAVGKVLPGYEADIGKIERLLTSNGSRVGELRLKPLARTTFLGYAPDFGGDKQQKGKAERDWVNTGDVVSIQQDGNIEIITQHSQDLVFDKHGRLVEHWRVERMLASSEQVKGVQVVQVAPGCPVVAVVVPKTTGTFHVGEFKKEMVDICREHRLDPPDQLAMLDDFPRVNTKIQKFKIRDALRAKRLSVY